MRFVLAPLAGFTDAPFRRLCAEGGADLVYTEMVSAAGLAHGSSPTRHLMETDPAEGPVALQVFGANESDLACAAREAEKVRERYVELNLNAGCPMTKVTREGAGAKLAADPAKTHRLLKAMVENTALPVTLKTRLGPRPDRTTVFELLDAAEQAGAKGFVLHARYTSQMHGGAVHLDLLADVVHRAHVPVTGNGSVTDAASAAAMAATGVDAIMIGRAALANPGLFAALKGACGQGVLALDKNTRGQGVLALENETTAASDARAGTPWPQGVATCRRHLAYLLAFRDRLAAAFPADHVPSPDGFASVKMHTHLFRYFNGRPGAAALRARLNTVRTLTEIYEILDSFV